MQTLPRLIAGYLLAGCCAEFALAQSRDADHRPETQQTAAQVFPASTIAYVDMPHPDAVLATLMDHPLYDAVRELPQYQQAMSNRQALQLQAVVKAIEGRIGMDWQAAWNLLTSGGLHVGFDAETQAVALMARSNDEAKLHKTIESLVELMRGDARINGRPDPLPSFDYRGINVYRGKDGARLAVTGPWFISVSKESLGKSVLDALLDGQPASLAGAPRFQAAIKSQPDNASLQLFVDLETLRSAGAAPKLFSGQIDHPLGEVLFGGIAGTLSHTPFATLALTVTADQTRVIAATPHETEWTEETREYFFGPDHNGRPPQSLHVAESLFSLRAYRNLAEMWLRAGEFFSVKTQDELAKADGNLSTLFGGRDFGEEILGSLAPEIQLVVARQSLSDQTPQPALRLPAFALVGRLRDAEGMRDELRRSYQSLIGFVNVTGAMNGNPQLDLGTETLPGGELHTATFVPEPDERDSSQARIHFNFSPSMAITDERFVVASTKQLARELALAVDPPATESSTVNTHALLIVEHLHQVLLDNRGQLVARNIIEQGHSRDEAEGQVDLLLDLLHLIRSASIELRPLDDQLQLELLIDTQRDHVSELQ